ncbi:hypothetical protein [Herbaspirillum huttiense]|uniref:hypothetical protein n=1 Tax=Herbaspirillum huttiense TaxID=863372 RepID=UPI0039AF2113
MDPSQPDPSSPRRPPSAQAAGAALLRPPGTPHAAQGNSAPDHIVADPGHVVEPDGTEDPLANIDDDLLAPSGQPVSNPSPPQENAMHKPQDTPPVEVPPLDPTPPQDPIPHQNPMAGHR